MTNTISATHSNPGTGFDIEAKARKFLALQRREFGDHKVAFFWAPILIAGLIVLGCLTLAVQVAFFDGSIHIGDDIIIGGGEIEFDGKEMTLEELREKYGTPVGEEFAEHGQVITAIISSLITSPLLLILPFIVVFPLLSSLYDERMDRSFLFWKSMPVSDTAEVLSKLVFIVVVGPLMLFLLMAVVNLAGAIIATPVAWIYGFSAWEYIWSPTPFVTLWLSVAFNYFIYAAWALPVLAWLMLASAVAPKAPLLIATIPVAAVAILEKVFLGHSYLMAALGDRLGREFGFIVRDTMEQTYGGMDGVHIMTLDQSGAAFLETVGDPSFWIGTVIAAAILYGAIVLRRFRV